MISVFFPLKKLRRNSKCLLFSAILLVCAVAVYNEMYAARAWSSDPSMNAAVDENSWRRAMFDQWFRKDQVNYMEDSAAWASSYTPQTWKPEYKGQANLHVFEDWCGGSIAGLRKNLHYPLYPHTRTTVQKLAVSPQWTNYGLRIFGYLHPYIDGDFAFALSSDDNSEFWLSSDDSPLNVQLLAWVGKTGTEWTAPGEFDKYSTQTSRQVWLSAQRRYFFEVIHKQDHKGTDHVEVAWQFHGFDFMVIESRHMSLYVNESTFSMSDVTHIPQTAASHQITPPKQHSATVDMLRKDLRDTLYQVPLINSKFLQGVLPDCVYKPSYTIKDFPLLRYQGLKFVHMSYIYPNDYTRLTHMESESSCFYPESNFYFKMYGFSEYMRLDHPDMNGNGISDFDFQQKLVMHEDDDFDDNNERERESRRDQNNNALFPDYGDDFDDYSQKRTRKLFSVPVQEVNNMPNSSNTRLHMGKVQMRQKKYNVPQAQTEKPETPLPTQASKHHLEQKKGLGKKVQQVKPEGKRLPERQKRKSAAKKRQRRKSDLIQLKAQERPVVPTEQLITKKHPIQRSRSLNQTRIQRRKASKKPTVTKQQRIVTAQVEHHPDTRKHVTTPKRDIIPPLVRLDQRDPFIRKPLREKEMKMMVKPQDVDNDIDGPQMVTTKTDGDWSDTRGQEDMLMNEDRGDDLAGKQMYNRDSDSLWQPQEDSEGTDNEDFTPAPVFDAEVKWSQTFQFNHLDIQAQRSDRIDLHCNISGNLLLHSSDTLPVVEAFMEQLNKKHNGRFALERVVNVVKRVDKVLGNRYLLELLLRDGVSGQLLRLSKYVYVLIRLRGPRHWDRGFQNQQSDTVLSNPVGFRWNPDATVHFIIPVKNQGRWVRTLIDYMEKLFRETGDTNFNLIITDYDSTDMDVRKALQKSSLPRYQYVRLTGDFERSAGLQAGVDLINDDHSIVFLCDLHINFPSSIIDTIRKHCVEGYMAFAPIIMRLDCGATPLDPRGYWEVNGFGLLGIYKSDLNAVGGMNTKEFKKQWGGEDWELLDRILQAGLEVERIYLRNFFHHFHSRRGMWNRRIPPSPSHR